jgi:hypothetical protein
MIPFAEMTRVLTARVEDQADECRTPAVQKYKFIISVNINLTHGIGGDMCIFQTIRTLFWSIPIACLNLVAQTRCKHAHCFLFGKALG